MTNTPTLREALLYARETCAQRAEANGCSPVASEWRAGLYDRLPDIQMRVSAYCAGYEAALSAPEDDARLTEALRLLRWAEPMIPNHPSTAGGAWREVVAEILAADRIEALSR